MEDVIDIVGLIEIGKLRVAVVDSVTVPVVVTLKERVLREVTEPDGDTELERVGALEGLLVAEAVEVRVVVDVLDSEDERVMVTVPLPERVSRIEGELEPLLFPELELVGLTIEERLPVEERLVVGLIVFSAVAEDEPV